MTSLLASSDSAAAAASPSPISGDMAVRGPRYASPDPCSSSTQGSSHSAPLRLDPALLAGLPARLRGGQRVFDHTGGLHAAGLFNGSLTRWFQVTGPAIPSTTSPRTCWKPRTNASVGVQIDGMFSPPTEAQRRFP